MKVPLLSNARFIFNEIVSLDLGGLLLTVSTGTVPFDFSTVSSGHIDSYGKAYGFEGPGYLTLDGDNLVVHPPDTYIWGYSFPYKVLTKTSSGVDVVENGTFTSISNVLYSITGLPTNYFHVLFGQEEYITESYDVIAGDYPDENDMSQMALIVDSRNQIPLKALKELGFYQDTDNVDEEYAEENPITFDEILNKKYKVFTNSDFYNENLTTNTSGETVYYYTNDNLQETYDDPSKGIEVTISGILRPKKESTMTSMAAGLAYQNSLQEYLVSENKKSNIYSNILLNQ